jgi:chitodextrinase
VNRVYLMKHVLPAVFVACVVSVSLAASDSASARLHLRTGAHSSFAQAKLAPNKPRCRPRKTTCTQPTTPTGLAVTGTTQASISLAWTASTDNVGVTGYALYLNGTKVGTTAGTSYTFSALSCGTSYTLGVAASDAAGNVSSIASSTRATSACSDTTPPSAPSGLAVTGTTQTGISLAWTASTDNVGVAGYALYLNGTKVGTTAGTSYTFSALSCGTSYTLGVAASDAGGNVSSIASTVAASSACPDSTPPTAPTGLAVTTATQTGISVGWNASTDNVGVTGYSVYVNGTKVGTTARTSYTFSALSCGTSYTLGVAAYDAAGNVSSMTSVTAATFSCVASGPCGTAAASAPATLQHVVWIWMENETYTSVIGNTSAAPYLNQLAGQCGLATNYAGVAHPSLPNYIAATSGSTQGITDDNPPSSHPLGVSSIFGQVNSKSYEESMPSNCALSSSGSYAVKHNPEAYYTAIRTDCNANDVPMGSTSSGAFLSDLTNNTLPAFSFVTPNMCNDMHDCSIATGDAWLKSWVPKIIASPAYQAGQLALFITWDENDGSAGNQVPTIVASPYTPAGTTSATSFNHYSLLRTAEELLGTTNYLGNAASATSMRSAFFSPALVSPIPTSPQPPPPPPPPTAPTSNYLFDDEFNGAAGTTPDTSKWQIYGGSQPPRWGLECFVNDANHIAQDGNGNLVLTATYNPGGVPCTNGSGSYESGGLHTGALGTSFFNYKFGKAEARIKVPCQSGTGLWPAWWQSGSTASLPWPNGGEIDNLEVMKDGGAGLNAQQTIHGPTTAGGSWQLNYSNVASSPLCNDYHVYGTDWRLGKIDFLIDGNVVHTVTPANLSSGQTWPFDVNPEQLILDLQVGSWGGTVDNATLPQSMLVDWVRVSP